MSADAEILAAVLRRDAARLERLARCVRRTADRLHDLGGRALRMRGHAADGFVTDQRIQIERLIRDAERTEHSARVQQQIARMWGRA